MKIDLESIWLSGGSPISYCRRLRNKGLEINRVEFAKFIDDLTIEVNLVKSSAYFENTGIL